MVSLVAPAMAFEQLASGTALPSRGGMCRVPSTLYKRGQSLKEGSQHV